MSAVMAPYDSVFAPRGQAVVWSYLPKNNIDRLGRGGDARVLVQHLLGKEAPVSLSLAREDTSHNLGSVWETQDGPVTTL